MHRSRKKSLLSFMPLEERLTPAVRMLPDLIPDPSNLAGWTVSTVSGVTKLAYATGMQNLGKGAFELRGTTTIITNGDGSQSQVVNQRVYNSDGTFADQQAGAFVYHPTHGHVHYDDFAWGRIRTRPTANWEDGTVVAIGPKTSFCLLDLQRMTVPGSSPPAFYHGSPDKAVYNTCSSQVQGISVGWKDIYSSGLEGQQIDITGVPNGNYWLEVVADPMNHVEELDETNNTARIAITLTSQPAVGLRVLSASPLGAQNDAQSKITVNFNEPVDPTSFTPADVTLSGPNGPISVTSVTQISSVSFNINFATQTKVGTYSAIIGPNIAAVSNGKLMNQDNDANYGEPSDDAYVNIFTITAPRAQGHTPSGAVTTAVSSVRVQYNKPLDNSTFTFADIVSFTGPGGGNLMGQISGIVPVTSPSSALFDINFASMTGIGAYTLVLEPDMTDMLGNTIDQNGDLITNAADRYTITFSITPAGISGPDAFGYTGQSAAYENLVGLTTGWTTIHNSADDANIAVNLGTNTFTFHGNSYTGAASMFVSTNGLITFGAGSSAYENNDLSSISHGGNTIYPAAIAPLWDDWVKGPGTPQVRGMLQDINSDGKMDRYLVQWNQVNHYSTSASGVTFTAILQLNTGNVPGDITFNYQDLDAGNVSFNNGASATVGIRAAGVSGTRLVVSQNSGSNSLVNSNKAVRVEVPKVASITRVGTNPISAGSMEFLVTFTEPVTGVDPDDFAVVATGKISGAYVDHIHSTADPKQYLVHAKMLSGAGTLRVNLIDNDSIVSIYGSKLGGTGLVNGNFTTGAAYNVFQPPPQVQGINVGDGTSQRSRVDTVRVVFGWPVSFAGNPSDAFVLTGPNGTVPVTVDLSESAPNQTTAKLTFSGPNTLGGSLKDGNYLLTALSSEIHTAGVALDGDADGDAGGDYAATFHRFYGDIDGNGTINAEDFAVFGDSFGFATGQFNYKLALDFDGLGSIDAADFAEFGGRFGLTI